MTRYRWTHPKPLARPNPTRLADGLLLPGPNAKANHIHQGQIFEPTECEIRDFADRIEEIKEKK